jgi:hydroxymethylpyrimidine/phosphomethylpyrimidine kinase
MINNSQAAHPIVLSIAGSDPSGGAGIQADLKTATAFGVYGAAALTSLTVQNTRGVADIHPVPPGFVADECRAVLEDLQVGAIKIGMLATPEIAAAVAGVLTEHPGIPVVLDPVMIATSGDRLVTRETTAVIRSQLVPQAHLITPNLPETSTLLDCATPATIDEMIKAAQELRELGAVAALVKGGHLDQDQHDQDQSDRTGRRSVDVLADSEGIERYDDDWIATVNTHGTGCTLSTAIACRLAAGVPLRSAVRDAKDFLLGALRAGADLSVGAGRGPVDHLWQSR